MAIVENGIIHGTGGTIFTVSEYMFLETSGYLNPSLVVIPDSGTFTNCSKVDAQELSLTNPVSDSTFSFPLQYTMDEVNWYTSQISGILYHSLGTRASFKEIRTLIGETTDSVRELCSSNLVNRYAEYCPDTVAPHNLKDFWYYAHTTQGGSNVRYTIGNTTVSWGGTQTIRTFGSRIFKEISGRPYSDSRVAVYNGTTLVANSSTVDFDTVFGAYCSYTTPVNDKTKQGTTETYYAKVQHYYSSAWVDGDSETISVTYASNPYGYSRSSIDLTADTCTLIFTFSTGFTAKFQVNTHGYDQQTVTSSPTAMEVSPGATFHTTETWTLHAEVGSGNWVLLDSGTVSR